MQGDFEAFYLRHFKAIYRVCYAFMKNAPDAAEDAFVKAMTCGVSFENERHERAWLTTMAMNLCKDRLKHFSAHLAGCLAFLRISVYNVLC